MQLHTISCCVRSLGPHICVAAVVVSTALDTAAMVAHTVMSVDLVTAAVVVAFCRNGRLEHQSCNNACRHMVVTPSRFVITVDCRLCRTRGKSSLSSLSRFVITVACHLRGLSSPSNPWFVVTVISVMVPPPEAIPQGLVTSRIFLSSHQAEGVSNR